MTATTLPRPGATLLTDADRALLAALADGKTLKRIAADYATNIPAVQRWIGHLLRRTGTENRTHLVATAVRCGWLNQVRAVDDWTPSSALEARR